MGLVGVFYSNSHKKMQQQKVEHSFGQRVHIPRGNKVLPVPSQQQNEGLSVELYYLQCGPGHLRIHTSKRMWPHSTTSE